MNCEYFYATWSEVSVQYIKVLEELEKELNIVIKKNDADKEESQDLIEKYDVENIPSIVFKNKDKDYILDPIKTTQELVKFVKDTTNSINKDKDDKKMNVEKEEDICVKPEKDLQKRLKNLVNAAPVMLFMKGSPSNPKCKFSRKVAGLLKEQEIIYGFFDILTDRAVRDGLKIFSNWNTYPQMYIGGKLIGGGDIIEELIEDDKLKGMIPKGSSKTELNKRLGELVNQSKFVLFMKGNASEPKCGFSKKAIALLQSKGFEFTTFDILTDNDVRQGLKKYSNWPTYPQFYANGKLIGGLDVLNEMAEDDELTVDALA